MSKTTENEKENYVFALDIGTRSIIGIVGVLEEEKLKVLAIEREEHSNRAMVDGQIEDIEQVAKVARIVKGRLEEKLGFPLHRVCVAAAGRALKTQRAAYDLELPAVQLIDEEILNRLESGAIEAAEEAFESEEEDGARGQFYLVGYSVVRYLLDNYPISNLFEHRGKKLRAEIIATFLPGEVVESLYTSMNKAGLEVASLTLEPIAAINATIPPNIRLLNLALVDIGAGTSDIAISKDGSVIGYTMATVAGDEVTEALMKKYLISFAAAESIKMRLDEDTDVTFTDILGFEHTLSSKEIFDSLDDVIKSLCREIAEKILEVNASAPSAVFLVGGGSQLVSMRDYVAQFLNMDLNRVAIGGNNFQDSAFSDDYDIKNPEFATPLGIAISSALNLINDSFYVLLNGSRAKLFRSGKLTVRDILLMNGSNYKDLISRSGQNIVVELNGKRMIYYGSPAEPAKILINDEEAKASDVVQAGDSIVFEPAKPGADAQVTLGQVIPKATGAYVLVNKIEVPIGLFGMVNGKWEPLDFVLHTGDKVEIDTIRTLQDLLKYCEMGSNVLLNGVRVPLDTELSDGDEVTECAPSQAATAELPQPTVEKAPQVPAAEEKLQAAAAVKPKKKEQKAGKVAFYLNGRPLILEKKADGMPYYMMDLLQHADIDLENPKGTGTVVMKLNGEDALFSQELKHGDNIQIAWAE